MVKHDILIRHIRTLLLSIAVMAVIIIAAVLKHADSTVIMCIIFALIFIAIIIALKFLLEIRPLSSSDNLIKIKGFVFRQRGSYELSVLYYDMIKLDYRIFTQDMLFYWADTAKLGSFVNLIGIRTDKKVKIVRILSF